MLDLELFGTSDKRCCGLICAGDVGGGDGATVDREELSGKRGVLADEVRHLMIRAPGQYLRAVPAWNVQGPTASPTAFASTIWFASKLRGACKEVSP